MSNRFAPKQQLHGMPMYLILHTIIQMNTPGENGKKRWATAGRIGKELGERCNYIHQLLDIYWAKRYVKKLIIKKAGIQDNSAGRSSFHWVITNKGKRRYQDLQKRFGDVAQYAYRHPALVSVPLVIAVPARPEIAGESQKTHYKTEQYKQIL